MNKRDGPPRGVMVMGVVFFVSLLLTVGILAGSIMNRTKTGSLFHDLLDAEGPWTGIERFYNEHVLGYPPGGTEPEPVLDDGNPFN